jgi:hypothetical protein
VQAFDGNSSAPYAATLSAVKAALHCFAASPEHNSPPRFMVSFPVVATSSQLFECFLDEGGAVELREIDRGFLFFQQRIGWTSPVKIAIVAENDLGAYIQECNRVWDTLMALFKPTVQQAWKEYQARSTPPTHP